MSKELISLDEASLLIGRLGAESESHKENIQLLQSEIKELREKLTRANLSIFALFAVITALTLLHPAIKETLVPLLLGKFMP
jgi:prefoldin subunit 5